MLSRRTCGMIWGVLGLLLVSQADAQHCRRVRANMQGTARADVTVSSAAITVLLGNTSRCGALIENSSANDMRCAALPDGAPTSTTGFLVPAGTTLVLGPEGQEEWQCIRTGASNATASVVEGRP